MVGTSLVCLRSSHEPPFNYFYFHSVSFQVLHIIYSDVFCMQPCLLITRDRRDKRRPAFRPVVRAQLLELWPKPAASIPFKFVLDPRSVNASKAQRKKLSLTKCYFTVSPRCLCFSCSPCMNQLTVSQRSWEQLESLNISLAFESHDSICLLIVVL